MNPRPESVAQRRRFILKRLIGKGSFGEVYLAEQDSGSGFTRTVAVKLLDETASRSKEVARRMRDEARLLGRLRSRFIVDVYDLVRLGDRWGVVMEYVPGADLDQVLQWFEPEDRAFSPRAALSVGAAVARALELAWGADDGAGGTLQVVHRDLKPANIRLSPEGDVKVLDFGVARFSMETREAATRKPGWLGTERYMAPERILLEGDGPEGDIYALGATLLELILGRPLGRTPVREEKHGPFVEQALDVARVRMSGADGAVDEVIDLLRRMLAARPEDRPAAAALVEPLQRLGPLLDGDTLERVAARVPAGLGDAATMAPVSLSEGSSGDDTASAPATSMELYDEDDPPAGARPRWALVAGAVTVLAGLVALWAWSSPADPASPPVAIPVVAAPAPAPPVEAVVEPEAPPPVEVAPTPAAPVVEARVVDAPPRREAVVAPPAPPRALAAPTPEAPPPADAAPAPRVSKAMIVVENVDGFRVSCGDRASEGTLSVRVTDFPAGRCEVAATLGGRTVRGSVVVDRPREVRCRVDGGSLSCS